MGWACGRVGTGCQEGGSNSGVLHGATQKLLDPNPGRDSGHHGMTSRDHRGQSGKQSLGGCSGRSLDTARN